MLIDRLIVAATLAAGLALAALALRPDDALAVPAAAPLVLATTPLPLNRDDPAVASIGALQFRGAVQLRSADPAFGGISGLRAGPGNRLLAITDTGNWLAFDTVEPGGRLTGVANAVLAPILQPDGAPAATKAEGDAEALAWDPATGIATIAYEQDHRLDHFAGIDSRRPPSLAARPVRTERLSAMTGWPLNGGGEALAVLPGGTRIIIAEDARRPDGAAAALITRVGGAGETATTEIGIGIVPDHSPTDAIALDDRRILVLNRRYTATLGQGAALTLVDLGPALGPAPPATLPARLLARWEPPVTIDNMEGLAIRRSGGRTFVYLVSDDNLNSLQRTILMKFELDLNALGVAPPP
jgi:hypothetical protein